MNKKNKKIITLDKFIYESLYDKKNGFYMKKNPFGKKGDFITAPNISVLFSEMIAIWIISFWKSLNYPKKFNLIELGAGNGEMMKVLISTFENFPNFLNSCNINILEKSQKLKKIQKKNLRFKKIKWLQNLDKLKNVPNIFIANEFFDSLPIKQFILKNNKWHERYVKITDLNNAEFIDKEFNIKNFEKKINYKISKNQKFIEYSPMAMKYLSKINKIIELYDGGILIIDYGYLQKKMKNTLQAISNHRYSNLLNSFGKSDITYHINFNLLKETSSKFTKLKTSMTNQREFLINMGIIKRAEIISNNLSFTKKANIFYRLKRLIDNSQMGKLFKVMFITNKYRKFKVGFN